MKTILVAPDIGLLFHEQVISFAQERGFRIISAGEAEECELIAKFSSSAPKPLDLNSFPELRREIPIVKPTGEALSPNRAIRRKSKPRKK